MILTFRILYKRSMSIHPFLIYRISILYLVIPIIFFFLGWLSLGIGLLLAVLLSLATYLFFKRIKDAKTNNDFITFSKEHFIALVVFFMFLLSTGNTGFVGCWGVDIPWRNAIYQDLIRQNWPVIYEYSHSMLCYYMTFWLVPAAVSSWFHLGELGSNIILFLWMYIGLLLIFFLLCDLLKPKKEYVVLMTIMFLFFSGINIFGMIFKGIVDPDPIVANYPGRTGWAFSSLIINDYRAVYIIRTIFLCLADVYNQFFAIALATLLFLRFRSQTEFYAFIGLLVLPYSPIGFIGVFAVVMLEYITFVIRSMAVKSCYLYCRQSLSTVNLLAAFSIVPIFYLYFSMNIYAPNLLTDKVGESLGFLYVPLSQYGTFRIALLIVYYYLYFGIYAILLYEDLKKESLYWIILFCLIVFPFFKIGSGEDFNFNATISPYLILLFFILKHLLNILDNHYMKLKDLILVFCLSIAMLTPIIQISTSFRGAYLNNAISCKWSPWPPSLLSDSFRDKKVSELRNFISDSYDNQVFFKYMSKR